jgi:c-di-GMP-binding flagellar brake protein YcgR
MQDDLFIDELFYPGNNVQVEYREDLLNKKILLTTVDGIRGNYLHLFYAEEPNHPFMPIPSETGMILCAKKKNTPDIYFYTTRLLEHKNTIPAVLVVERPALIQASSRRTFFRCDVELPFYFWVDEQKFKGQASNISAGGMYGFIPHEPHLKPGMILRLEIQIPQSVEPLIFEARIIRFHRAEKPDQRGVALEFFNPNVKLQNELVKYIFLRQRELIQKGKIKVGRI